MNKIKRSQVFEWLRDNKFAICLLQETHISKNMFSQCKNDWKGECVFSGNFTNKEGVAILFNSQCNVNIIKIHEVSVGRILGLDITIDNKEFLLINIYGPNNDDSIFFTVLENFLCENNGKNIILGGDFNTIMDCKLDRKNGNADSHKRSRQRITNMMNTCNLFDVWRQHHPNKKQYTWHSNTKPCIHSRLDYFLISTYMQNICKSSKIIPGFKTDHCV